MKVHYVQQGVGHYGVFNGTRWRTEIQPRIREFIRTINYKRLTGNKTRAALSRYASQEPLEDAHGRGDGHTRSDVTPEWRATPNGTLNGVNGKHPPAAFLDSLFDYVLQQSTIC